MKNDKCIVISIVNQKGGVGKTTTSISLAGELASRNYKTLLIDLDPQGDTSRGLGYVTEDSNLDMTSKFLLMDEQPFPINEIIIGTKINNLNIIQTSCENLARTMYMIESDKRRRSDIRLKKSIKQIRHMFDFIIIDCCPTDNILSTNALVASDYTIIPVKYDKFSLAALDKLYRKILFIQEESNENLEILGILPTMYTTSVMMKFADDEINEHKIFSSYNLRTKIRNNIKAGEAPFSNLPINLFDKNSNAAKDYKSFTNEILEKMNIGG